MSHNAGRGGALINGEKIASVNMRMVKVKNQQIVVRGQGNNYITEKTSNVSIYFNIIFKTIESFTRVAYLSIFGRSFITSALAVQSAIVEHFTMDIKRDQRDISR